MKPLYSIDSTGRLRWWAVETDDRRGAYRTVHGIVGAGPTTSEWSTDTLAGGLQATVESLYRIKLRTGYTAEQDGRTGVDLTKPMLAAKFDGLLDGMVASQPKLDGVRCIARQDGLWSRTGVRIESCPHVEAALAPLFEVHPDVILDGELYNHDYRDRFDELSGAIRRKSFIDSRVIEYHVYDCVMDVGFAQRMVALNKLHNRINPTKATVRIVNTIFTMKQDVIDGLFDEYLRDGYEGQMIRRTGAPYELGKRSKSLMKRKNFDEAEFEILDVIEGEGNWSGAAKTVICRFTDGRTFDPTLAGTYEAGVKILAEKAKYIGGTATVSHFGYTNSGLPRFPIAKAIFPGKRDM